jgi:peptide/nickel transport system permease protein
VVAAIDPTRLGRRSRRQSRRHRPLGGTIATAVLVVLVAAAVLAPLLPLTPNATDLTLRLASPKSGFEQGGWQYILGGDELGRPLLARLVFGARISLLVGVAVPILAAAVGVTLGLLCAEYKGVVDRVIMRAVDIWMSMPALLFALAVLYLTGPGFTKTIFVLAAMRWMVFARLTRGVGLSIEALDYVEVARSGGCTRLRIMLRHVLPNCRANILILMGLESARAILSEAALSFLGLGVQPPQSSWGTTLAAGRNYLTVSPWTVVFAGAAVLIATLCINIAVDSWSGGEPEFEYR